MNERDLLETVNKTSMKIQENNDMVRQLQYENRHLEQDLVRDIIKAELYDCLSPKYGMLRRCLRSTLR